MVFVVERCWRHQMWMHWWHYILWQQHQRPEILQTNTTRCSRWHQHSEIPVSDLSEYFLGRKLIIIPLTASTLTPRSSGSVKAYSSTANWYSTHRHTACSQCHCRNAMRILVKTISVFHGTTSRTNLRWVTTPMSHRRATAIFHQMTKSNGRAIRKSRKTRRRHLQIHWNAKAIAFPTRIYDRIPVRVHMKCHTLVCWTAHPT